MQWRKQTVLSEQRESAEGESRRKILSLLISRQTGRTAFFISISPVRTVCVKDFKRSGRMFLCGNTGGTAVQNRPLPIFSVGDFLYYKTILQEILP